MDPDDIDPEIAAAMGFDSFGGKPSKRRKFNHDAAVIDGQDSSDQHNAQSGSGANNMPLGVRTKPAPAETPATGDKAEDGAAQGAQDGGAGAKEAKKSKAKKGAPRGLADYISWGNSVPQPFVSATEPEPKPDMRAGVEAVEVGDAVVGKEAVVTGGLSAESWPQGMPSEEELRALRRGVKNRDGDMVYFQWSFIEDPWRELVG